MKINTWKLILVLAVVSACKKEVDNGTTPTPTPPVLESVPLKSVATFPIAVAGSNGAFLTNPTSSELLKRDFNGITFENEMKNSALVTSSGGYNFATADAMVAAAQAANIQIHGHVLAWHSQAQGTYYRSILNAARPSGVNLVPNPGFETGDANSFVNFTVLNSGNPAGTATITAGSGAAEVRSGSRSMKVVNPTAYTTEQWRVQVATDPIPLTVGKQYQVSYWVKAATANGSIRLSTQPTPLYQGDQTIGTAWQQVTWLITANEAQTRIVFDMGRNSNTYFIDDVSVNELVTSGSPTNNYTKVDSLLKTTIQQIAGHFKGKVRGWDVINEMFADGPAGAIRNNTNTANATANDIFVWSEYLGRDFGVKAFTYAAQADPTAKLFINDYNLEFSTAKLDSLIAYVAEIRGKGAKVDGIGTQMHVSINTSKDQIDAHFKKLAATGLLVHVSELDIGVNTNNAASLVFTEALENTQAEMYSYIVTSYMRNVPKAQRYGITIWGLLDNQSWRYRNGADYPLLYTPAGTKKKAYDAVLNALRSGL
ncbi:endo-1,4-beta-xylanase [Fibrella aestuarina BUZ 2]|uniref:Beta-xylanase n=1 Tax=Fibrella aestuarina BUZ 2 TaxID=1166018 RepID=I0KB42_9BACT|nr:endo-1,4-beta-xylanase [Fibrella aestuarina]CCH01345.1 endo-1,4-beta-xylanase [Fibrella aestuarina BUZ 2]